MGEKGTKRVLEYARLAMGFANVRGVSLLDSLMFGRVLGRVLMLVLVQAEYMRAQEEAPIDVGAEAQRLWFPLDEDTARASLAK